MEKVLNEIALVGGIVVAGLEAAVVAIPQSNTLKIIEAVVVAVLGAITVRSQVTPARPAAKMK